MRSAAPTQEFRLADIPKPQFAQTLKPINVDACPAAFAEGWRRGVELVGKEWFVDDVDDASGQTLKQQCLPQPNILLLTEAMQTLGGAQRLFFALLVSFFCPAEGEVMLRQCRFSGFADLSCLDHERRQVIADLVVHCGA